MKLELDTIYDYTPREFANAQAGRMEAEKAVFQAEYQSKWEQVRWLGTVVVNVNRAAKTRVIRPEDLIKFPWEKKQKQLTTSLKAEEAKQIMQRYKYLIN